MIDQAPPAYCSTCGSALAPDGSARPGRSKAVALVLLLVPPLGLLGLHRIYLGMRSGWVMLVTFLLLPVGVLGAVLGGELLLLVLAPLVFVGLVLPWVDLVRILTGSLQPAEGWS